MNTSAQAFGYVHRYLPPSGDDPRTLLLLHGTGGDENDLVPLGQMLAPDAGILSPRGTVNENGAARFFKRLAEGVFDVAGVFAGMFVLSIFVVLIDMVVTLVERRLLVWRPVVGGRQV